MRDWNITENVDGDVKVTFGDWVFWIYQSGNHWEIELWEGSEHVVTYERETIEGAMAYAEGFYDQITGN